MYPADIRGMLQSVQGVVGSLSMFIFVNIFEEVYLKFNPQYPFITVGYIDSTVAFILIILSFFGVFGTSNVL